MDQFPGAIHPSHIEHREGTVFRSHVRATFSRHPVDYTGELVRLLDDIASFTRDVSATVSAAAAAVAAAGAAGAGGRPGGAGALVATPDSATVCLYRMLAHDGYCCIILSKGFSQPLTFGGGAAHGSYVVCVSPLDSDTGAADGAAAGTLFSVYRRRSSPSVPGRGEDLRQRLGAQVAAGYASYASATTLHYTMGHGAFAFNMHPVAKQYLLSAPAPRAFPAAAATARVLYCDPRMFAGDGGLARALEELCRDERWTVLSTGCLVGDLHLLLLSGGVLAKCGVHLLCEAAPAAYVVEQAGGTATDDAGNRILGMQVQDDHDMRVTLVLGSKLDHVNLRLTASPAHNGNGAAAPGLGTVDAQN